MELLSGASAGEGSLASYKSKRKATAAVLNGAAANFDLTKTIRELTD